ncbi:serine/threonine-protein kinase [Kitasatospora sp. NPDC001175]|uniref:serine/threonine-protein kinase n=1 Tax=Kitasatospora sp. NPDC001175 TaxID=3157103 RepID=UPI003D05C721
MRESEVGDPGRVGPYEVVGRLGEGGMGIVYLARTAAGRAVAVKTIRAELAAQPEFRERFRAEVAAARRVGGFHTAQVVDADPNGSPPWLATAYVAGGSLREAAPLSANRLRSLAAGLAEALAAIHAAGVVHRDLKPSNVLLTDDGPRVIDFGIARALEGTVLTVTGVVMGSPGFLSPEQALGEVVGPPSDVFALGAVLAFAAGARGFGDGPAPALLFRVVHDEPDLTGVPAGLLPVIRACLAKDPAQRPTAAQLLAQLTRETEGMPTEPAPTAGPVTADPAPTAPATVLDAPPCSTRHRSVRSRSPRNPLPRNRSACSGSARTPSPCAPRAGPPPAVRCCSPWSWAPPPPPPRWCRACSPPTPATSRPRPPARRPRAPAPPPPLPAPARWPVSPPARSPPSPTTPTG